MTTLNIKREIDGQTINVEHLNLARLTSQNILRELQNNVAECSKYGKYGLSNQKFNIFGCYCDINYQSLTSIANYQNVGIC